MAVDPRAIEWLDRRSAIAAAKPPTSRRPLQRASSHSRRCHSQCMGRPANMVDTMRTLNSMLRITQQLRYTLLA
eukprot:3746896-Pyramimonas_sp.AAC.1